jgi:hypothetical protein
VTCHCQSGQPAQPAAQSHPGSHPSRPTERRNTTSSTEPVLTARSVALPNLVGGARGGAAKEEAPLRRFPLPCRACSARLQPNPAQRCSRSFGRHVARNAPRDGRYRSLFNQSSSSHPWICLRHRAAMEERDKGGNLSARVTVGRTAIATAATATRQSLHARLPSSSKQYCRTVVTTNRMLRGRESLL